jgi:hypothetical protein
MTAMDDHKAIYSADADELVDEAAVHPPPAAPLSEMARKRELARQWTERVEAFAAWQEARVRDGVPVVVLIERDLLPFIEPELGGAVAGNHPDTELSRAGTLLKSRGWSRRKVLSGGDRKGLAWIPPR